MNQYGEENGIEVQHYIISSGLKEIIEGNSIARYFSRIYASSYLYSADGVAEWPAQAVNYTNKTQFIFRIAKGIFEEYDEKVNDSMPDANLYIPYENIVYIGDSATDIPCMRLVKSKGVILLVCLILKRISAKKYTNYSTMVESIFMLLPTTPKTPNFSSISNLSLIKFLSMKELKLSSIP